MGMFVFTIVIAQAKSLDQKKIELKHNLNL